ncbi:hypothetical protein [Thermoflavimicrobium daqui]|jgi:hypothetical protein|uniref:Uncharacterized protein n=1 Tax=Thermoflavimicrobium daqui TaxID=2137476 RepID=A0A364K2G3_9BACL|nr:hypothetical protein [Thermoflavimicrobium daqui]RAL22603.1 hypothetical protein DL897_14435 [Thermoflavimicrobium daqui]
MRRFLNRLIRSKKYPAIFHSSNWKRSSYNERLEALTKLEEEFARKQGRESCPVKEDDTLDFYECGYYDPNEKAIYINSKHLEDHQDYSYLNYLAVETIIHEGRHAYQDHCIEAGLHDDKEELQKWIENDIDYYEDPPFLYRFQILERDANDYANIETDRIFESLEKEFGENVGYSDYVWEWREEERETLTEAAMIEYGENFIQKIDERVREKYLAMGLGEETETENLKERQNLMSEESEEKPEEEPEEETENESL